MFVFKLNIIDRLSILMVMPKQSNYSEMSIVKEIKEKIAINDTDIANGVTLFPDGSIRASKESTTVYDEFEFSNDEIRIIADSLFKANSENKLNDGMVSIYELFVIERDIDVKIVT